MILNIYMKFEVFVALHYLLVSFLVVTFTCDGPNKGLPLLYFHWPRQGPAICRVPLGSVPAILTQAIIVLAVCILTLKMEAVYSSESWYSHARLFGARN
jgi:hypothetical protein